MMEPNFPVSKRCQLFPAPTQDNLTYPDYRYLREMADLGLLCEGGRGEARRNHWGSSKGPILEVALVPNYAREEWHGNNGTVFGNI